MIMRWRTQFSINLVTFMRTSVIITLVVIVLAAIYFLAMNNTNNAAQKPEIVPIEHASFVMLWQDKVIYVDPVGADKFVSEPSPDLILITDIHEDHLDPEALQALAKDETKLIMPQAAALQMPPDLLPRTIIQSNGEKTEIEGFSIEALPMYNLPEKPDAFHTKGRGNGYVVGAAGHRVYISGDTSGIPEMRALKSIDMAFVAMNPPYTMDVVEAAGAVLEFAPKEVYPYHYRNKEGFSDVAKFKELVEKGGKEIKVIQLKWY